MPTKEPIPVNKYVALDVWYDRNNGSGAGSRMWWGRYVYRVTLDDWRRAGDPIGSVEPWYAYTRDSVLIHRPDEPSIDNAD